jgi:hypothetical protein
MSSRVGLLLFPNPAPNLIYAGQTALGGLSPRGLDEVWAGIWGFPPHPRFTNLFPNSIYLVIFSTQSLFVHADNSAK